MGLSSITATGLIAAQALATPVPGTFQPAGKWSVSYEQDKCILSRAFVSGSEQVTLAITPAPVGDESEIALILPGSGRSDYVKKTTQILFDAREIPVEFNTLVTPKAKMRVTRIYLAQTDMDAMTRASTIRLPVTDTRTIMLAPKGLPAVVKAGATCRADLRASWGIDEAANARIVTPARGVGVRDWITDQDYPPEALRAEAEGAVSILWTIGTDGRVTQCRTLKSSGLKNLDDAACRALTNRARYRPAKDAAGNPVKSWSSRTVRWVIPTF